MLSYEEIARNGILPSGGSALAVREGPGRCSEAVRQLVRPNVRNSRVGLVSPTTPLDLIFQEGFKYIAARRLAIEIRETFRQ